MHTALNALLFFVMEALRFLLEKAGTFSIGKQVRFLLESVYVFYRSLDPFIRECMGIILRGGAWRHLDVLPNY
jgi:hypothetical protein